MTTRTGVLRFSALGAGVVLTTPRREILERLEVCYGAWGTGAPPGEPVRAEVVPWEGRWRVRVGEGPCRPCEDVVAAVRTLNHELLHAVMRRAPRHFYVHAGVVAHRGGGVVLPGLSRAGKSTLVLALLQRGAGFLSDELLVYDGAGKHLLAFPRAPKIRDACVSFFPDFRDVWVGEGEGRFLPLEVLGPVVVPRVVPRAVVVPRWTRHGDVLEPITAGEALLALAESALNFGTHGQRSLDLLADLCRGVVAFRLAWSDPHRAAALIHESLRDGR